MKTAHGPTLIKNLTPSLVLTGLVVVCLPLLTLSQPARTVPGKIAEYQVEENDSTIYTLKLAYDQSGLPAYFFRNVFTPVCFTDVCKPVYIDLYWDLLGNYVRFEVPPSEPLTKVDHEEFGEQDYDHLHRILSNPESLLKGFTIFDLVDKKTYNLSDTVDAVTGATPKTIQSEVIAGAVYTCFTLWHIANGPVVQEMKNITERHETDELLHNFLQSGNHHYQYWALDKVIERNGTVKQDFLNDVLRIVEGKNIFIARYALGKIPNEMLGPSAKLQDWLWTVFQSASYPMQMEILKKLENLIFSPGLSTALAEQLSHTNEEQFLKVMALLEKQKSLPEDALLALGEHLNAADPARAARVYETLSQMEVTHATLRKEMKLYKKSNR